MDTTCPVCGKPRDPRRKFCSRACYFAAPKSDEFRQKMSVIQKGKPKSVETRQLMSAAWTGRPKPWAQGENNVNFGGKSINRPEVKARYLDAVKQRGLAWTDADRQAHSERMRGPSNAMRGATHSEETKARISATKRMQYADGTVNIKRYKISKPEREIAEWLSVQGEPFKTQFHIKGVPYLFDFYLLERNLLLDFHGNYWHANPAIHKPGGTVRLGKRGNVPVEEIWERDHDRQRRAEQAGFLYLVVWECHFKTSGFAAITDALDDYPRFRKSS